MRELFLPGLPVDLIRAAYLAAPGNEIESGKFAHPESSAALVANAFGLFLDQPSILPPLPGTAEFGWPATSVGLEAIVKFPWSGGRHPCLDVLVTTRAALIGIESKRYEPFRPKSKTELSDAYWRPVWGNNMQGYERIRDQLRDDACRFDRLDAAQLVKHAFGLRTAIHQEVGQGRKTPVLYYLYAEPTGWPDGRSISSEQLAHHKAEIAAFADMVKNDEVRFIPHSYRHLLTSWAESATDAIRKHAAALRSRYVV